jgi:hypothetical protein
MSAIITATGLSRGTIIQIKIRARNAKGWGDYSQLNTAGVAI